MVSAPGACSQTLQRRGREGDRLDPDRVDGDVRLAGGLDRALEGRVARRLLPVGDEHEHAAAGSRAGKHLGRSDDGVVQGRAVLRVDGETVERSGGVGAGPEAARAVVSDAKARTANWSPPLPSAMKRRAASAASVSERPCIDWE